MVESWLVIVNWGLFKMAKLELKFRVDSHTAISVLLFTCLPNFTFLIAVVDLSRVRAALCCCQKHQELRTNICGARLKAFPPMLLHSNFFLGISRNMSHGDNALPDLPITLNNACNPTSSRKIW